MKRLRILEADKAKKARMKELMDKAQAAYAEGNYVEAEAYAKRATEIDPNEVAAIDARLQGQDRAPLQARPGEPAPTRRTASSRPSRKSTWRRSPTPRSSSTASSTPRTSRT